MTTQLLYQDNLFVPINVVFRDIYKFCEDNNITYEKNGARNFLFYAEDDHVLRLLKSVFLLKSHSMGYEITNNFK